MHRIASVTLSKLHLELPQLTPKPRSLPSHATPNSFRFDDEYEDEDEDSNLCRLQPNDAILVDRKSRPAPPEAQ